MIMIDEYIKLESVPSGSLVYYKGKLRVITGKVKRGDGDNIVSSEVNFDHKDKSYDGKKKCYTLNLFND